MSTGSAKRPLTLAVLCLGLLLVVWLLVRRPQPSISVGVVQIASHPSLFAVRDGVVKALEDEGMLDDLVIEQENADGQPAVAKTIIDQFIANGASVIIPITTPCAEAAANATASVPIVFGAVTNPVGAGLVDSLEHPGGNITGVSDLWPISKQIALMREIVPTAETVGVIYNPGETNNDTTVPMMREAAEEAGFDLREVTVASTSEIRTAALSLVGDVDILYTAADSTVAAGLSGLIRVAEDNRVPLFVGDVDGVEKGGIATIGAEYSAVGYLTGQLVARVLRGENPGAIPVVVVDDFELVVNPRAADRMGVTIPQSVMARADRILN